MDTDIYLTPEEMQLIMRRRTARDAHGPHAPEMPRKSSNPLLALLSIALTALGIGGGALFVWFFILPAFIPALAALDNPLVQEAQTAKPTAAIPATPRPAPPPEQQPASVPAGPGIADVAPQAAPTDAPTPPTPAVAAPTPSGLGVELAVNGNGARLTLQAGNPDAMPVKPALPVPNEPGFAESFQEPPDNNPFVGCLPAGGGRSPNRLPAPSEAGFQASFK